MARYPLNQPVRVSTTVKDVTGTLVNAGALTLLVKLAQADGTQSTTGTYASPTNDGTGLYHQDIPVTDLVEAGTVVRRAGVGARGRLRAVSLRQLHQQR